MDKIKDLMLTDEMNEIVQIGIVVEDMEKIIESMRNLFGLEPDATDDVCYKKTWYRGEIIDAPVRNAFYNYFNVQLEFLQPLGEQATTWKDYLTMGQYGLHHIRFDVTNTNRVTKMMEEKGVKIWMQGESIVTPGCIFTYYDTLDMLGFVIETVTRVDHIGKDNFDYER